MTGQLGVLRFGSCTHARATVLVTEEGRTRPNCTYPFAARKNKTRGLNYDTVPLIPSSTTGDPAIAIIQCAAWLKDVPMYAESAGHYQCIIRAHHPSGYPQVVSIPQHFRLDTRSEVTEPHGHAALRAAIVVRHRSKTSPLR